MDFVPEITRPLSNPVLIFALLMALLFVAPQLAKKVRVPGIVGLIVAGAVVGPSVLNLVGHDPDAVPPDFMGLLGTAGLMYLMFQAGLSLDLARFQQLKGRSVGFGLMSFCIPAAGSIAVGYYAMDFSVGAAFLLGAIIGSHTLIAFPIAARLGLLKQTGVTMALGGTLVTDTLSLSVLAVVVAATAGETGVVYWLVFAGLVGVFVFLVLWGLPKLGYHFFRTVRNRPDLEFGFLLTVLFGTAWLAETVGLAPIIGAFVAGIALNRLVPDQSTIMARVRFLGEAFFVPLFMIYVGLLIDVSILVEGADVWVMAGMLVAMVCVGKLIAAKLTEKMFGYSSAEGWVIYGLTTPQAAATLAVTLVGFEAGVFVDEAIVNAVVLMIVVTSFLGSALVEKFGRIVAREAREEPAGRREVPERILVPVANPETSDDLLELAFLLRDTDSGEPILPMMVASDRGISGREVDVQHERMQYAVERGAEAEVPVKTLTRIDMNVARGIARAAREEQATLIVIGWSGRVSARERIFGTVLDQLLGSTRQMVFVNRFCQPVNTHGEVVLTIPPFAAQAPGFMEAIHDIKLMVSRLGAQLRVVTVGRTGDDERGYVDAAEPEMEVQYEGIERWSDLTAKLDEIVDEETYIVSLSSRPDTVGWFRELNDLPGEIAARYPDNSFSVVFLAEPEIDERRRTPISHFSLVSSPGSGRAQS